MASRSRVAVATRFVASAFNTKRRAVSSPPFPRIACISRLGVEARCLVSMMPLHSAIAKARLTSVLSPESQIWGRVPLGLSMPL